MNGINLINNLSQKNKNDLILKNGLKKIFY